MSSLLPWRPRAGRRLVSSVPLYALPLSVLAAVLAPAETSPAPAPAPVTAPPTVTPATSTTPFKAREHYFCTRVPALVTTPAGVLLAFAEGRDRDPATGCHDVGDTDLILKRSLDGGRTWDAEPTIVVGAGDELAHGNPAPVVDAVTGRITLLHSSSDWNRDRAAPRRAGFDRTVYAVHSTDGGLTWGPSTHQPQLDRPHWSWVSTGPGHGIQLARGRHRGRLVVAGDHHGGGKAGGQLYLSDDGGLTWALGAVSDVADTGSYPGEPAIAETTDGNILVNARNSEPTRCLTDAHRLGTTATDGGAAFAAPFVPVANLDTSPVFGSLLRLHARDLDGRPDRLLFSAGSRLGPHTLEDRRELAVRSSTDEGRTWQTAGTLVSPARTGYSDLALLADGSLGVLYETGAHIPHGSVVHTSFTEKAMDEARTELRLPRTSDTRERPPGERPHHALVHGGARLATRLGGRAMEFDGRDDHLRVVCSPPLRVDGPGRAGDFTVTAWFRHTAGTGTLPIVWAYGAPVPGSARTVRHFSVRAEPGAGVLRATAGTDAGTTDVTLPSAYGDGAWHHVVLTRQGLTLGLAVDGGAPATAVMPTGPEPDDTWVTPAGQFSLHIGARPDFPDRPPGVTQLFRGTLDDVRLFGRALSGEEAARVRGGSLDVAVTEERLRLGFTTLW